MAKYIDSTGLAILWGKVKGLIPTDTVTDTELVEILSSYVTTSTLNTTVDELEKKIAEEAAKVFTFKGNIPTYNDLPTENLTIGDVYSIETADPDHDIQAGDNVVWTGDEWSKLAGSVDLTNYATKTYVNDEVGKVQTIINSMPDEILSDIVNVTRTDTTNTAEIQIFTKQEDGTYSSSQQHGVLTLVAAGTVPGAGTGAGLMTVADKEKLDGIEALSEEEILAILV